MNTINTNSGGWRCIKGTNGLCGTSLSSYSGTIIAVIPAALRAVLEIRDKVYKQQGQQQRGKRSDGDNGLFLLLSEYEVFGSIIQIRTKKANRRSIRIIAPETAR